ncbi:MAG: NAD(P)-dependent oxidoreductase [Candidatus Omnitrophota bacterium]
MFPLPENMPNLPQKILITGGSGYVGKALIGNINSRFAIRVFGRTPVKGSFEFLRGDIRNAEEVLRAAQGVDFIIHLAAATPDSGVANDRETFKTNVGGTLNVLEAAVKNNINKVIYSSSVCAVGFGNGFYRVKESDPCCPSDGMYGYSKYLSEKLCELYAEKHALRIVCLRLATVTPQHEFSFPSFPYPYPYWLTFVHIEDVVRAINLAIENEQIRFGIFHIAPDNPHSRFDISRAKSILGYRPEHNFKENNAPRIYFSPDKYKGYLRKLGKRLKMALKISGKVKNQ